MSNKSSYMNRKYILSEGFFDKFFKRFKDRKKAKTLQKDKNFRNQLKKTNKSVKNLEDIYSDIYGVKLKLDKFKLSDFI